MFGKTPNKRQTDILNLERTFFFRLCISAKEMWKYAVIISRSGKTTYIIQGPNWKHKRHVNQLKHRFTKEENEQNYLSMEILCDLFNLPTPQGLVKKKEPERNFGHTSKKKKRFFQERHLS